MLTIQAIRNAVQGIAQTYPIKRVMLFGSYANGKATEQSDVDVLVEFLYSPISILEICGFQEELKEALHIDVDALEYPVKNADAEFLIGEVVCLYESARQGCCKENSQ